MIYVEINETLTRRVGVETEDEAEAMSKVMHAYGEGSIILDAEDFCETTYRVLRDDEEVEGTERIIQ